MSSRAILQAISEYQKARIVFIQTIADLATKPANVELMAQANILELVKPLINDVCPQIKQCAVVALGRLLDANKQLAVASLGSDILSKLILSMDNENKYYKKSVLYTIRSICKHDPNLAKSAIEAGAMKTIIYCLGDFEPMVKEAALWAVGYIAKHNKELAEEVAASGCIPNVVMCLQEPELCMKQVAGSVISDLTKHSAALAQQVIDCGGVIYLVKCLNNSDPKMKRIALQALGNIAKHDAEMAEVIVEANTFPNAIIHMAHACPQVRKQAASLVRDVVKHSVNLSQMVVNLGGIGALIETGNQDKDPDVKIPCFVALGYIAGHNDQTALSIMNCNGVAMLAQVLQTSEDDTLLAVTAWALGQIGKHGPEHAKAVAAEEVFTRLLELYLQNDSSADLREKAKNALKQCLQQCTYVPALEKLVTDAPPEILKYVLGQFSKILPSDPKARRMFITSGALKKIQQIETEPGSTLLEYITLINACFPDEIIRYYSPGYSEALLDLVEQYTPEMMNILRETRATISEVQTDNGIVLDRTTETNQEFKDAIS